MLFNLLYNGNLCEIYQQTRNLITFSKYFWKRCLQLKWKTKSDTENIPNWARFALTYRHPGHFWKLLGCLYSNKGGWFNSSYVVMSFGLNSKEKLYQTLQ
ncbi:Hypothetical_protein [Hexamita inflata]|uniref:Hypothetical_protein n=1 Tax=Hexamita inflata TaxID=28002 RepID=A0AA86NEQ3_9EUKA|nr:Hypothetical protein HINF_LOCUS5434 [Hexamita inflata]